MTHLCVPSQQSREPTVSVYSADKPSQKILSSSQTTMSLVTTQKASFFFARSQSYNVITRRTTVNSELLQEIRNIAEWRFYSAVNVAGNLRWSEKREVFNRQELAFTRAPNLCMNSLLRFLDVFYLVILAIQLWLRAKCVWGFGLAERHVV